jgi:heptaprenyl diphosphate synthase
MSAFIARIIGNATARGSSGTMSIMARFPLLVHAAEAGDPDGGRPAALIHVLWWTAARFLDDLADGGPTLPADPADYDRGILAALGTGSHLPVRLIHDAELPEATKFAVISELSKGWLDAIGGQLLDYDTAVGGTTPESVLAGYRGKTGAPYGMAAAMAACLAGAAPERVERWRAAGVTFGVLRQLVNDRRDIVSERSDDIVNGTATFLLAHVLAATPPAERPGLLALHVRAATSPAACAQLKARLLDPAVLGPYTAAVAAMVDGLHAELDALGGAGTFPALLHALVDEAMLPFPLV